MSLQAAGFVLITAGVACALGVVAVQVRADRAAGGGSAPLPPLGKLLAVLALALVAWGVILAGAGVFSS